MSDRPSHKQFKEEALSMPEVQAEYDKLGEIIATFEDGLSIYRKENAAGGLTYVGESCSIPAVIWDSAIGTLQEFLIIAKNCYGLEFKKKYSREDDRIEEEFNAFYQASRKTIWNK